MQKQSAILDQFGRPFTIERRSSIDASKTTDENRKHWLNADDLAPNTQLTPYVRRTVANRSLYECQNNTYGAGMIRTLVGDTLGTSPRLQVMEDDDSLNENIEDIWTLWSGLIDLPLKLRILAGVKYIMGECFGIFRTSKKLRNMDFPVDLNLKLVEPAQVTDGLLGGFNSDADDGVVCDEEDEVTHYKILKRHPGDMRSLTMEKPLLHKAENVLHWFQPERPDQYRGISPLMSALPIFAQLRRYSSATLTNAEWSAMITGVIESDYPAGTLPPEDDSLNYRAIDFVRGTLLQMPRGVKAKGFDPTQPTTTYEMFLNAKLREIGRCINMPFGKIAGDHSRYNYSSGRLDDGAYWKDRDIERQDFQSKILCRIFQMFLLFAREAIPALAARKGNLWTVKHAWHYDARPSSDPLKDANADEVNLTNGSDTLSAIAARDGTTVEQLVKQRRRDLDLFAKYNLTPPAWSGSEFAPVRQFEDKPQQEQGVAA